MGLLDLIPIVGKVLDRVLPDKAASEAAKLKVMELAQSGELAQLDANLKLAQAQTAINQTEAANPKVFVSGWRPFIGWICGSALAYQFVLGPIIATVAGALGHPVSLVKLDLTDLLPLLAGMLGLSGMRTVEKLNGVAAK